jgi:hypothetical protein
VRGLPFRAVPFYFDGAREGSDRVDVFGTLIAEPEPGGLVVAIQVTQATTQLPDRTYYRARFYRSTLRLKGDEIVEVTLPPSDPSTTTPAAGTLTFAVRIRAKQLR